MKSKSKFAKKIIPIIIVLQLLTLVSISSQSIAANKSSFFINNIKTNIQLMLKKNHLQQLPETKTITFNSHQMHTVSIDHSQLIIELKKKLAPQQLKKKVLQSKVKKIERIGDHTYKVKLTPGKNNNIISSLQTNPLVSCIEYDYPLFIQNIPADPFYEQQWNLKLLEMEEIWGEYKGTKDVVVAIIDTGILPNHPDLKDNIISGYDFVDNDRTPTDTSTYFSHGTHVAGIIGAVTNNSEGIAGINWHIKIMPIRVIGPQGNGAYSNLIKGINWASEHGAQVINLSLAGSFYSEPLQKAIKHAVSKGVTIVAAAGNNGSTPILYPAKYPEVISVGAVGPQTKITPYSNFGPNLDLVAPGGNSNNKSINNNTILSTSGYINHSQKPVYEYNRAEGTSMATPHVAGVTALLYSTGINDPQIIKNRLQQTAIDLGLPGLDNKYRFGLLNVKGVLNLKNDN